MMKNDFSQPQRMGLGAFFIIFTKRFKASLAPLSIFGVYQIIKVPSDEKWILILLFLGICIIVPLIWALLTYLPQKFYVKDGSLVFMHGLISRENSIVPLDRVHSLRTEKGLWFRILGMRGIMFDTLATKEEEIELILEESEWQELLSVIEKEERPQTVSENEPPEYNPTRTVRYPNKNLLMASLCQNHLKGMAVLSSIAAVIFSNLQDLSKEDTETVAGYMDTFFESLINNPLSLVLFLLAVYVVILVLWLGKTFLRYYDTTMSHDKNLLSFTYGLLTRSSCRFLRDKICTIWIKRNFLEKRFGFSTLILRQALNATAQKQEGNMVLYGTDSSSFFLRWWLGDWYASEENVMSAQSGKGVLYRQVAFGGIIAIVAAVIFICYQMYAWLMLPAVYMLIIIPRGICAMRHSRIELREDYFVIHNGAFAEKENYIKYTDVEVVLVTRSPFTQWSHRASLSVSTSGTTFVVRSLREKDACMIREYLLFR